MRIIYKQKKFDQKPQDIDEYCSWINQHKDSLPYSRTKNYYEDVMQSILTQMKGKPFWTKFLEMKEDYELEYKSRKEFDLFSKEKVEIVTKSFDSVVDKTFRKNVIKNDKWLPDPDKCENVILLHEAFKKLNDCIRTRLVVKYLDGVTFVVDKLMSLAKAHGIEARVDYEAKEKGYYAAHVYIYEIFNIPPLDYEASKEQVKFEIQITTQIQDTIYLLTHKYYDASRSQTITKTKTWQWDYESDEFSANYMGHMLHYLEGIIMNVRESYK
ncbi:MAG: hypothetical protein A2Y31_04125 [Spirochaetes bacterium GWC2_52_13]|nr:MAG: hypothetical protein A2Y31_04125 [Spirochaetes bacterium GWC2_52_13]HCG63239.1 hypothetical protein [Sphaerochaeta sp.]